MAITAGMAIAAITMDGLSAAETGDTIIDELRFGDTIIDELRFEAGDQKPPG